MPIRYSDPFVARLVQRMGEVIEGNAAASDAVAQELSELAEANNPAIGAYWQRVGRGVGVPDVAFRTGSMFHFDAAHVVRQFRTSGTSGQARGMAEYSEHGLALMRCSVLANGRRHLFRDLDRPTVLRLVPDTRTAPEAIMAWGMAQLSEAFGDPASSASVVRPGGVDLGDLADRLDVSMAEGRPVVLVGGSFAFVHVCDALKANGRRWSLPFGSRMVDAGGFKGRSRELDVDVLRAEVQSVFGIAPGRCTNIFGMTELASQLHDGVDRKVGPRGERPKPSQPFVRSRLRDPFSFEVVTEGAGLLEIEDLCVLDRPSVLLTGDWGVGSPDGVAITGRVVASDSRGCALNFESGIGGRG